MTKHQNRTLGAFEKTFWLLDQIDSKDFALAAEVEGIESADAWRKAVNQVQKRHPNLSARIAIDEFKRPFIEHVDSLLLPLKVIEIDHDFRWEKFVEEELATRFDTAEGILMEYWRSSTMILNVSGALPNWLKLITNKNTV